MELKMFSWIQTACSNWTFSSHPSWASLCKKQNHPKRSPKKCCHNGSPNSIRNPPLPSRETLHKKNHPLRKCMLRCLPAKELEPVPPHNLSWKRGLHAPGTDCHRHLHWQMNSYRAHSLPRKYMEIQHQILTNSLKYCLMTSIRIQFPWERKFGKLTLVENCCVF